LPQGHDVSTMGEHQTLKHVATGASFSHYRDPANLQINSFDPEAPQNKQFGALFSLGRRMEEDATKAAKDADADANVADLGEGGDSYWDDLVPPPVPVPYGTPKWKDWTTEAAVKDPAWACTYCSKMCGDERDETAKKDKKAASERKKEKAEAIKSDETNKKNWATAIKHGYGAGSKPLDKMVKLEDSYTFDLPKCKMSCYGIACKLTSRCQCAYELLV